MEKVMHKVRIPLYLIIVALIVVAAAAVGIYFLTSGDKGKEPSHGTYVIAETEDYHL
jgi:flagellar basal body-associated protein FliL